MLNCRVPQKSRNYKTVDEVGICNPYFSQLCFKMYEERCLRNRRLIAESEGPTMGMGTRALKMLRKRVPIFGWMPDYKKGDLIADLIAGVTVGLTVVPQSMAYAAIAGLSPEVSY